MKMFSFSSLGLPGLLVLLFSSIAQGQEIRFVDDDAAAGGDGLGWASAYHDLQDALDEARLVGSAITEIRLAGGRYTPDRGTGDVELRFELVNGVSLVGGFAGVGAPDPDGRDIDAHASVLSGDILGNDDQRDFATRTDNSRQTLIAMEVGEDTIIDGIVVSSIGGGSFFPVEINGSSPQWRHCRFPTTPVLARLAAGPRFEDCEFGGHNELGLWVSLSDVSLLRCTFRDSGWDSSEGGAIRITNHGTLDARECSFIGNGRPQREGDPGVFFNGGAVHLKEQSSASFTDCDFLSNYADGGGGAVAANESELAFSNCRFIGNETEGGGGGAVFAYLVPSLTFEDCVFESNAVGVQPGWGGARGGGAISCRLGDLSVARCRFTGNTIQNWGGGAISIDGGADPANVMIADSTFSGNRVLDPNRIPSNGVGGALRARTTGLTVTNSRFQDNAALREGGAIYHSGVGPGFTNTITDCSFIDNRALTDGGAVHEDSPLLVTDSHFIGNTAAESGGALWSRGLSEELTFDRCAFFSNHAEIDGGAVGVKSGGLGTLGFHNCLLDGNSAGSRGGAVFHPFRGVLDTLNSTFAHNEATAGGGIATQADSPIFTVQLRIHNTILWNNTDAGGDAEAAQIGILGSFETVDVNHSLIEGLTGGFGGTGNLGDDPLFVDADGADDIPGTEDDDLRLSAGSPAIDTGDTEAAIAAGLTTDLDGNERIVNDLVDMGAYEFVAPCPGDIFPPTGGDGVVDIHDLLFLLRVWGNPHTQGGVPPDRGGRPFDIVDFLLILANWGPCPE